jgi:dCTP deaminase
MHEAGNLLREVAQSAIEPELEKIRTILQGSLPANAKFACVALQRYLERESDKVLDSQDLVTLRTELDTISQFLKLILSASPDESSRWAAPLIRQCYSLLSIDTKRDILVVHSQSVGLNDFGVYAHVQSYVEQFIKKADGIPLDIYVVPAEAKFDLSLICLLGHEVGHVYWQMNKSKLVAKVNELFKTLPLPKDLFEQKANSELARRLACHIEEYLCDQIGRYLLGPAFDFALLKLFLTLPTAGESETHPPQDRRIKTSNDRFVEYLASDHTCYPLIETMRTELSDLQRTPEESTAEKFDLLAGNLADELYAEVGPTISERFSAEFIHELWEAVSPELIAFRPPFETVSTNTPKIIPPTNALVGAVLFYFGKCYKDKSEYFLGNVDDANAKQNVIKSSLIDHLRYAISLYGFVEYCGRRGMQSFNPKELESTLWSWRTRKVGGQPNSFVVVPSTDPIHQYGQNSVDIRLGCSFLVNVPSRFPHIDPKPGPDATPLKEYYQEIYVPVGETFVLHPHQFVLASILEYLSLPHDHYGLVVGRSTWGRLGLNIATATTVQAGYRGCLTLELRNLGESPLPLAVGVRIAQLCLIKVPHESSGKGYFEQRGRKYVGPTKAGVPAVHADADWDLLGGFGDGNRPLVSSQE